MKRVRVIVVVLSLVAGISCARGGPSGPTPAGGCAAPNDGVVVRFGDSCVEAEVARTDPQRQKGLMGRTELGSDAGMLFVFPGPREGGFWMRDTLIPLSIAFMEKVGKGRYRAVSILDMQPCEAMPCPVYSPGVPYEAALEVNLGWFEGAGVDVGAEAQVEGELGTIL